MSEATIDKDLSEYEKLSDDNASAKISEMAEMISIYYDEIKSIAKNLEAENFPLPAGDIDKLHNSLVEYARLGTEFADRFKEQAEKLVPAAIDTTQNPA